MFDSASRSTQPELMDTEAVDLADLAACLRDLAAVNTVTLARGPTLHYMRQAYARGGHRPLDVLDVGCGDGDMLRRLHRWAARSGRRLNLSGIDLNPATVETARAATPSSYGIGYHQADVFDPATGSHDIIISSLFTHHLADAEVVRFLAMMEARARLGWFVNDLHRHPLAFHGFRALSTLAGWHRFVRNDGPVSVARAFRAAEWRILLDQAGLAGAAQIRWRFPFRYCVSRLK